MRPGRRAMEHRMEKRETLSLKSSGRFRHRDEFERPLILIGQVHVHKSGP